MTKNINAKSWTFTGSPRTTYVSDNLTGSVGDGIDSVSGIITDGQTLTISGNNFGLGASNLMFENYENGIVGSQILSSNTNFDGNSSFVIGLRDADSRSGSKSASVFQQHSTVLNWRAALCSVDVGNTTEVFVSYAVKVPSGSRFPGTDGGISGTNADYSSDSSWKTCWYLGDGGSSTDDDLVTPTHTGNGSWSHSGNDLGNLASWGSDPSWWKWGQWNRMSSWVKAGATPEVDTGDLYFSVANSQDPLFQSSSNPVIFANGTSPYRWQKVQIPGWLKNRDIQDNIKVLYDDVYVAWGANAAARVELGNASTYSACTDLAICDYSSWADGSITATCREGGLNLTNPTWLYVTLADNTTRYSIQVV